jgi:hypothetical protein
MFHIMLPISSLKLIWALSLYKHLCLLLLSMSHINTLPTISLRLKWALYQMLFQISLLNIKPYVLSNLILLFTMFTVVI